MTRKQNPIDPRRLALAGKLDKARADYERWYVRLKRAFTALEKAKRRAVRLSRQLDRLDTETATTERRTPP
jgi:hypothetical protein